ncbi:hypothetical protein M8J76_006264 [Diaphorina citri]|nr:hypothetical protein M8J76_006264 [Diaphorina citri]
MWPPQYVVTLIMTTTLSPSGEGSPSTVFVIMGVSGSGKSTIGESLATRLGVKFIDGDHLHPQSNIDKMSAKQPLNDEDRRPWLNNINRIIHQLNVDNLTGVLVCSALRRNYRDIIRNNNRVVFIYLKAEFGVILSRLQKRAEHFMPADLLESQFQTLEEPDPLVEPDVRTVSVNKPLEGIVSKCCNIVRTCRGANS